MGLKFATKLPQDVVERAEKVVHKASNSIILAVALAAGALILAAIALVVATRG